jgi:hypothetical protein
MAASGGGGIPPTGSGKSTCSPGVGGCSTTTQIIPEISYGYNPITNQEAPSVAQRRCPVLLPPRFSPLYAVPILLLLCPYPNNCQVDLTIGPIPGGLLMDSAMCIRRTTPLPFTLSFIPLVNLNPSPIVTDV